MSSVEFSKVGGIAILDVKIRLGTILTIICFCIFIGYLVLNYLSFPLWYDEIISIDKFIHKSISRTRSYYPFPNNHVLYNILVNQLTRLLQWRTFEQMYEHREVLRFLSMQSFFVSIFYIIRFRFALGNWAAFSAAVIFAGTLPMINIAPQIRGHMFGIMLMVMFCFHALRYLSEHRNRDLIISGLVATAAIYTVPVFVLPFFAIGVLLIGHILWRMKFKHTDFDNAYSTKLGLVLVLSVAAAAILYWPILDNVLNNRFVKSRGIFRSEIWTEFAPQMLVFFFSGRTILFLISLIGFYKLGLKNTKKLLVLVFISTLPFIISYIHGDKPMFRAFLFCYVFFALFAGILLGNAIDRLKYRYRPVAFFVVMAISAFGLVKAEEISAARNLAARKAERSQQDILSNYFQFEFNPEQIFLAIKKEKPNAVVIPIFARDDVAHKRYAGLLGIKLDKPKNLSKYQSDEILFLTTYPQKAIKLIKKKHKLKSKISLEYRTAGLNHQFYQILEVTP